MFDRIIQKKTSQQKAQQLTAQECQEIFNSLNSCSFFERKELTDKKIMPMLDHVMQVYINCHDVTRELAKIIQNSNWQRFPGYLVERKVNVYSSYENYVVLKHHSVIKNVQSHIFYECLLPIYPLDKYLFIPHNSSLKGWDIDVGYS